MGFIAGYTTSNTKVRFDTFGGMMTGNTVKLGITMQQGDWEWTAVYIACIIMFAIGTVVALFMRQSLGDKRSQHVFLIVFCCAFASVDGFSLLADDTPDLPDSEEYNIYASLVSSLVAFALGAQNLLSSKCKLIGGNTTFMTGNIQKMSEASWNACTRKGGLKTAEKRFAFLIFCTWSHYVIGVFVVQVWPPWPGRSLGEK
jgi:uncharacterized membrane protein YoaK (UPF0700 family)